MYKIILFLLLTQIAFSEEYYIFISKENPGVVISAVPKTDQYFPTNSENKRYNIFIIDLTIEEISALLEQDIDSSGTILSERKIRIKMNKLKDKKQHEKITKEDLEYESAVASTSLNS